MRKKVHYDDLSSKYLIKQSNYLNQYNNIYQQRLNNIKPLIIENAKRKWRGLNLPIVTRIIDSQLVDQECILVGLIYKEMKLRASVLDEIRDGYNLSGTINALENYTSDSDQLYLEDESGRVHLIGQLTNQLTNQLSSLRTELVTGVIMGVRGKYLPDTDGSFTVIEWVYSQQIVSSETINKTKQDLPNDCSNCSFIAFISGLEIGNKSNETESTDDYLLVCQLLIDYLTGKIGGEIDKKIAKNIVRVVLAGNSISLSDPLLTRDKEIAAQHKIVSSQAIKQFDVLLSQLVSSCPVDLMPGPTDPSCHLLPQQPFHSSLLPYSIRFNTLTRLTNPSIQQFNDLSAGLTRTITGHSGLPVDDIMVQTDRSMEGLSSQDLTINILRDTLQWGHLAPTAPDTLPCYPFTDNDPFIIDTLPDIYFCGNQEDFNSQLVESYINDTTNHQTLLLSIPSFYLTRQIVLVDLITLTSYLISFQTDGHIDSKIDSHTDIEKNNRKIKKRKIEQSLSIDYNDTEDIDM